MTCGTSEAELDDDSVNQFGFKFELFFSTRVVNCGFSKANQCGMLGTSYIK